MIRENEITTKVSLHIVNAYLSLILEKYSIVKSTVGQSVENSEFSLPFSYFHVYTRLATADDRSLT